MGADVNEVKRMFASCLMFLGNSTVHDTCLNKTKHVSCRICPFSCDKLFYEN